MSTDRQPSIAPPRNAAASARVLFAAGLLLMTTGALLGATAVQVFRTPQGTVENLRFEQAAGGTVNITYDLRSDDPNAVFTIVLEVTGASGAAITPASTSGDIGAGVRPGTSRRIVWAASRDVEDLQINQFKFNIRASAGAGLPVGNGGVTVNSMPPGAVVFIDGARRGVTPLTVPDLPAGVHDVRVVRDGYEEERRSATVVAGQTSSLGVNLRAAAAAGSAPVTADLTQPATSVAPNSGGGGGKKLLWIGLGVAGAAGAGIALAGGGGDPPPPGAEICGNGIDDDRDGQVDENPPCAPPPLATCTFAVGSGGLTSITVPAAGGVFARPQVSAQNSPCTGGSWTTSTTVSWLSVTPQSGTAAGEVQVSAEANSGGSRSGSVTVAGSTAQITQDARPTVTCTYSANFVGGDGVPPNSTNTAVPGDCSGAGCGTRLVDVRASDNSCVWTVDGAPSWFAEIERPAPGSRNIRFQVYERNTTGRERSASFRVAGVNFTVTQCAGRC